MAYVGNPIDTQNTFQSLQGKRFNGDGSTTDFTLDVAPSSTLDIEVFVGNVRQDPNSAYTLSGTTLTFTGAPPSGTNNIYVVHQAKSVGTIDVPDDIISGKTLVTLDNSNDHVLIEDATDGELKKALIPAASFAGIDDQSSSNDDQLTITDTAVVINEDSDDVDFRVESNGNANMLFVSGGNDVVGIGNEGDLGVGLHIKSADSSASANTAADELVVEASGQGGINILTGNTSKGNIFFGDDGDDDIGRLSYSHNDNSMRLTTNGSERLRIDSSGRILANTTSTIDTNAAFSIKELNNYPLATKVDATVNTQQIGFFNGNGQVGGITTNGSATAYNTSSDYRLKENISYDFNATTRLKQLKPARFNWIADDTNTLLDGFLAHEVSSIVPEAINGDKDATETKQNVILNANGTMIYNGVPEQEHTEGKEKGTYPSDSTWVAEKEVPVYQSIDQAKLVPLLVKTVQELEARIKTLEEA